MAEKYAAISTVDRKPRGEMINQPENQNILEINHLKMFFPIRRGVLGRVQGHVRAVNDVSLAVKPGETLGLVGESGCGKTTLGRSIVRAYAPTEGEVLYRTTDKSRRPGQIR